MPIYDYKCPNCNQIIEVLRNDDGLPQICEECQVEMERLISVGTSFTLKGRGWSKDSYNKPLSKPKENKTDE
jgi:putative FmdB family regulatory protein